MDYQTEITQLPEIDVAVAGGGIAGVYAALGAAGEGASVALIETQSFLGGQGTAGGVHTFCGETRLVNDDWRRMLARLRDLDGIDDYRPNADGRAFDTEALKFVLQEMVLEAGVRLYLHTTLVDALLTTPRPRHGRGAGAEAAGTWGGPVEVDGLVIHNKSGLQYLAAKQFVDATGDADIVARAGLAFDKGGPALKPGPTPTVDASAGQRQLPMSLYFTLVDTGTPQRPVLPPNCPTFADDEDVPMITLSPRGRLMAVKMKVIGHDVTDGSSLSSGEIDARRQMMGVIYHLQTKGYRGRTYETHRLASTSPHIGIREGRRVVARHVLSVDDVLQGRHQPDAVAVGSYHVDYHWPNVVQRAGTGVTTQCPPYQIPLRAMRPRDCENLLVPGRCMSGEQMAMSSFRVMGTCSQTGFAAGLAAALAATTGESIDAIEIPRLQRRLRARGVRLDLAPYGNYLRFRRGIHESVPLPPGLSVRSLAVALLPSGTVVAAVADRAAIWVFRRSEESWGEPVRVSPLPPSGRMTSSKTPRGPSEETAGEAALRLSLEVTESRRLQAEGVEEHVVTDTPEPATPSPVRLIALPGSSPADGGKEAAGGRPSPLVDLTSVDDGLSWVETTDESDTDELAAGDAESTYVEMKLSPGDPARRLTARSSRDGVEVSVDSGTTWRPFPAIEVPADAPKPAITGAADGLLLLRVDEENALIYDRIPVDALPLHSELASEPMAADWHHDDPSWIELLREPAEKRS